MVFSSCLGATLTSFTFLICIVAPVCTLVTSDPAALLARRALEGPRNGNRHTLRFDQTNQNRWLTQPSESLFDGSNPIVPPRFGVYKNPHDALETLQARFFEVWLGTWPDAIDWTAAVMGTHVSDGLISLTKGLSYSTPPSDTPIDENTASRAREVENEINKYFSQSVAYYFGENAFAIRTQAYDDMLWVVLGWLESIKFIGLHVNRHYADVLSATAMKQSAWYGLQFQSSFAHRAHIFYDLASKGWDTTLCGGGMVWNPKLGPYKNAITNELFISAAIGMYLYFPGDENDSPFLSNAHADSTPAEPQDRSFLTAAINAYDWISNANMTNAQGLYVDGFHIAGWGKNGSIGTGKCDVRNEMVYTYNQGVILSGLRGLWEGTGNASYLKDGHKLVRNVITATGWSAADTVRSSKWSGLGRNGILEDYCDSKGDCSQDSQGFKGIFFHHLTLFCEPLPTEPMVPGRTYAGSPVERLLHAQTCQGYVSWVARNAHAALKTRNEDGVFGIWWGHDGSGAVPDPSPDIPLLPEGAEDYRNTGVVPLDDIWQQEYVTDDYGRPIGEQYLEGLHGEQGPSIWKRVRDVGTGPKDVNDRGRGRTAETQGSGVAVTRTLWEFVHTFRHNG